MEWAMEWVAFTLGRLAVFKVLEYAGRLTVIIAVLFYFLDRDERRRNAHSAAWQVINAAHGASAGGRIDAMEFLCEEDVSMDGLSAQFANLFNIDLRDAQLSKSDLHRANLSSADLTDADLSFADLSGANLGDANLSSAWLRLTNFRNARNLDPDEIRSAIRKVSNDGSTSPATRRTTDCGPESSARIRLPTSGRCTRETLHRCPMRKPASD